MDVACTTTLRSFKFRVSAERLRPITHADCLCDLRGGRCIPITRRYLRCPSLTPADPPRIPNASTKFQSEGYRWKALATDIAIQNPLGARRHPIRLRHDQKPISIRLHFC